MPNVNLTAPFNPYGVEAQAIERQRQLAELMQQQSLQPIQSPSAQGPYGSVTTPISWTQGLAKMLQAYSGRLGQEQANKQETALGQKYTSDLSNVLQRAMQAGTGTPERPAQLDPQEVQQMADQGTPQPPNIPAQAPNQNLMASILMQHPATAGLGEAQLTADMQRKQRAQMLAQIMNIGQNQPDGTQPIGATQQSGNQSFAGIPTPIVGLMTSGDPELAKVGTSMLEASKGIAQRPGAPVVNPWTGAVIAQPTPAAVPGVALHLGANGTTASAVPGFLPAMSALESAKEGAKEQYGVVQVPQASGATLPVFKGQMSGFPGNQQPLRETVPTNQDALARAQQLNGTGQPFSISAQNPDDPWATMPQRQEPQGIGQSTYQHQQSTHEAEAAAKLSEKYGTQAEAANQRLAFNNQALDLVDKADTGPYAANIANVKNLLVSRFGVPEGDFQNTPTSTIALQKDLVNAATQKAKQQFGARITQSEVMLMLSKAAPGVDMTKAAIKFLVNSDNATLKYQQQQANDLGKYLQNGGDPYRFEAWYSSKFPMTNAVEQVQMNPSKQSALEAALAKYK
jgi:hypothetical protein